MRTLSHIDVDYKKCKVVDGNPCISCSKGVDLDALIAQARKHLHDLLLRQRDLHMDINDAHGLIINRLPPEVSSSIFLFSLSEETHRSFLDSKILDPPRSEVVTTPLTLGAICRVWRRIAWASPRLWADISIPVRLEASSEYEYLNIAREWIRRSGDVPISVHLFSPRDTDTAYDANLVNYLSDLICNNLHRCRSLAISCPIHLMPSVWGNAPLLEEIKITSGSHNYPWQLIKLFSTKSDGVRVSLNGYPLDALVLPITNVRDFEGFATLDECLSLFKNAPGLQDCHLRGFRQKMTNPTLAATMVDSHLEKLALHSSIYSSYLLLNHVNLPFLTHLTVDDADVFPVIHNFFLRTGCNLRSLRLRFYRNFGPGDLSIMLGSTNSLEDLYLEQEIALELAADDLFRSLARTALISKHTDSSNPQATTLFLPSLSSLTIAFGDPEHCPWNLAAGIFGSINDIRHPCRRPLKDLHITYDWVTGYCNCEAPTPVLSAEATRKFLGVACEGIHINLYDANADNDILRFSIAQHNMDVSERHKVEPTMRLREDRGSSDNDLLDVPSQC